MITPSLLLIALGYGVLSFIMAFTIWQLPVWCQSSWFLISSWGILWVCVGYTLYDPTAYPHIIKLAVIFLFALPGMMFLDYKQRQARVLYWEHEGIPEELRCKFIYLGEVIDTLCNWWITRRFKDEAIYEAMDIVNNNSDNPDNNNRSIAEITD